jgi:hypothetical protein
VSAVTTFPAVPDDVQAALAPLLAVGVTTAVAAEHLHMSTTDAWHYLDNLRVAGAARLCRCGAGVVWCCAELSPGPLAEQIGQHQ